QIFPYLADRFHLTCEEPDIETVVNMADFIFTALPHKVPQKLIPAFLDNGKKVVDLSADFRFDEAWVYENWYEKHSCPHLLKTAVYGLPEIYREKIKKAEIIANPGCYPTSVILGLAPLLKEDIIDTGRIIIDSASAISGAGREPSPNNLFCEVSENFKAYGIGTHRHTPEIEQEISKLRGKKVVVTFTPHLIPINRGILSTIYTEYRGNFEEKDVYNLYKNFYKDEKFIRVMPQGKYPDTIQVRGSNYCDLGITLNKKTNKIIILSAIDNLVKGAAGQAIQNMNLMLGLSEDEGLKNLPLCP
ncbi:MAG: N-acetyl-gamma-glutamyl-phosphate reductase, partial [Thermodesulfobacteriota bacterium]|nr:N-acetyl-gamma-glutamyl-phosphate reductase [Thermodesulfobacteriota bacterium]